ADAGQQRQDLHRAEDEASQEPDGDQSLVRFHRQAGLLLLQRPLPGTVPAPTVAFCRASVISRSAAICWDSTSAPRRRSRSPPSRISPLTHRNSAVRIGLLNTVRSEER